MTNKLNELKQIRDNAPEGATHYASRNSQGKILLYFKWLKHDQYATWLDKKQKWSDDYRPIDHIHSLEDINAQIELMEQVEGLKSKRQELAQKDFDEFWQELVCTDGVLDIEKVKNELHDFHHLIKEVPKVYDHVSGGQCSNAMVLSSVICSLHDDAQNEWVNQCVSEAIEQLQQENNELKEWQKDVFALSSYLVFHEKNTTDIMKVAKSELLKRDNQVIKQAQVEVLQTLSDKLITGAVANHWCEKEQAGYFWCHDGITNYIEQLKESE